MSTANGACKGTRKNWGQHIAGTQRFEHLVDSRFRSSNFNRHFTKQLKKANNFLKQTLGAPPLGRACLQRTVPQSLKAWDLSYGEWFS